MFLPHSRLWRNHITHGKIVVYVSKSQIASNEVGEPKVIAIPDGKISTFIDWNFQNDTLAEYVRQQGRLTLMKNTLQLGS
jgi:hypothetical protein